MTNPSMFAILRAEVGRTQDEYGKSQEHFWKVSAEVPDERNRVELAARAQTAAMIAYTNALHRFNEFMLNGKVPDDLVSRSGIVPSITDLNQEQQTKMDRCVYCGARTWMYEHDRPICMDCASRIDAGQTLAKKEPTKTEEKTKSAGR